MKRTSENIIEQLFGKVRSFVFTHTKKNKNSIESRLDALVVEKAKEQGVDLKLKKESPFMRLIMNLLAGSALLASFVFLVMFVPGPWTRFFAKPHVVSMALQTVNYTENGAIIQDQKLVVESPKAIRGVQYITGNLSIEPAIPYTVSLAEDKTHIVIVPSEELLPGTTYKVTLQPGVLFDDSTYLVNEQSWVIPTKAVFDIVSISPRDGSITGQNATIQIHFTTDEFDVTEAQKYVSIFPAVEGTFSKISNRLVFVPKQQFKLGGTYTVRVSKELPGSSGQTLTKEMESTFTISEGVSDSVTIPYIESAKEFYNHSGKHKNIVVYTESIRSFRAEAYTVTWEELRPYIEKTILEGTKFSPATLLEGKTPDTRLTVGTAYKSDSFATYDVLVPESQGVYVIKMYDSKNPALVRYVVSFRSNIGVYISPRKDASDADVWTFDYATKRVTGGVRIDAASCDTACTINTNLTPENGYLLVDSAKGISYVYAQKDEGAALLVYGGSAYGWTQPENNMFSKIITNKPVYVPQDQLKYTVLLREKGAEGEYQYPQAGQKYLVALCRDTLAGFESPDVRYQCIAQKEVEVSNEGQLDGVFSVWERNENLVLSVYKKVDSKLIYVTSETISVYEADKPQVQMTVTSDKAMYIGKDTVAVSGRVTNYVDSGIAGKPVTVQISLSSLSDGFEKSVQTDAQGNFSVLYHLPWEQATEYSYDMTIVATLNDSDNEINRYLSATWSRGDIVTVTSFVNNKETTYAGKNETVMLHFAAEKLPSSESTQKKVGVQIVREFAVEIQGEPYYDEETRKTVVPISYTTQREVVSEQEVVIEKDKGATITLDKPKPGSYYAIVTEKSEPWDISQQYDVFYSDEEESASLDSINEWVTGVRFAKQSVSVGEKATLEITNTFKGDTADIIFIEKIGEVSTWRKIDFKTQSLEIPVTKEMRGGLEVCVVHPVSVFDFADDERRPVALGNAISDTCANITVEDGNKKLSVVAKPEAQEILPGTGSKLAISVKNSAQEGVRSVVGVSVVDKAVYDEFYQGENYREHALNLYKEIYETFTAYSTYSVYSTSLNELFEGGQGAGGGDENGTVLRKDFEVNPYWASTLQTNDDGVVEVQIPYSDTVSTWVVLVWATTEDLKVGTEVVEVRTKKDVFLDVDTPKVLRIGDEWAPYVRVTNTTKEVFAGTLQLLCDGCLEGTVEQKISVPPQQTVDIKITSKVTKEGNIPFKAVVTQNGKTIDGMEVVVQVKPIGIPVTYHTTGVVEKGANEIPVVLPQEVVLSHSDFSIKVSNAPALHELYVPSDVATTPDLAQAITTLVQIRQRNEYDGYYQSKEEIDAALSIYTYALLERALVDGSFSYTKDGGTDYGATVAAGYAISALTSVDSDLHLVSPDVKTRYEDYAASAIFSNGFDLSLKSEYAYLLAVINPEKAVRVVTSFAQIVGKEEKKTVEMQLFTALALKAIGATSDASLITTKIMDSYVMTSAGGTQYILGSRRDLYTAMQLYLIGSLDMGNLYANEVREMQRWVEMGCTECSGTWYGAIISDFYIKSLSQKDIGSTKAEQVTVRVNGKDAGEFAYDGKSTVFTLSTTNFVPGNNTISITSPSGKKLYCTVSGELLLKSVAAKEEKNVATKIELLGASKGRVVPLGGVGHYKISVTANQDLPEGRVEVSLPTGLQYKFIWLDEYENKKMNVLYTYGDARRADTVSAHLSPMKKGETVVILVPFGAVRQGTFGGASVYFSFGDAVVTSVVDSGVAVQ